MNVSTSSMKFRSRGFQVRASLWWGRCRRRKERKSRKTVLFIVKSQAFLSLTLRELPHQREPLTWKPLLFIIQLHFTDDANVGGQGRSPLQNRVNKQSDKLKFLIFRFPFRKLSTVHYQLSTCLQLLIHHLDRQIGICKFKRAKPTIR